MRAQVLRERVGHSSLEVRLVVVMLPLERRIQEEMEVPVRAEVRVAWVELTVVVPVVRVHRPRLLRRDRWRRPRVGRCRRRVGPFGNVFVAELRSVAGGDGYLRRTTCVAFSPATVSTQR